MPSLLDSPPQLPSTCGWGALYPVEETVKPRHLLVVPAAAAAKKPAAYSVKKKNLEMCTEALGCETGGVDCCDGGVEGENAERKRRARQEEEMVTEGRACQSPHSRGRRPLPPPLTTLALGTTHVRMVHERRDGRLEVYAARMPGVLEAERSEGRLRLRLLPLLCGAGNDAAETECRRQEPEAENDAAKEDEDDEEEDEEYGFFKYVRGGRCVDPERGAAAARRGKQWEPEQAAAFWVATP